MPKSSGSKSADEDKYGERRPAPKRYPAQLIVMTSTEMAAAVRTMAAEEEQSVSDVLRELIQSGLDIAAAHARAGIRR